MLVFGGFNAEGIRIDDLWSYDIESNAWWQLTARGPWPEARMVHSAVFSRNWGTMLVFGGFNAEGFRLDDLWSYDIVSVGCRAPTTTADSQSCSPERRMNI